jgi:hypothetical protein
MGKNNEDDDIIEVGFHMGLCPEYEEKKLIDCMESLHEDIKYILIIECEQGMEYPYNRQICNKKYLLEAFDFDEATIDLQIKKGKVKKFIKQIETAVLNSEFLFDFSKEIAKEDFSNVITTGILVSRVALEGDLPGMASKMAFVCITNP